MANRAIIGNVFLGLGVIGLGALVVVERNGASIRHETEARSPGVVAATDPAREPGPAARGQAAGRASAARSPSAPSAAIGLAAPAAPALAAEAGSAPSSGAAQPSAGQANDRRADAAIATSLVASRGATTAQSVTLAAAIREPASSAPSPAPAPSGGASDQLLAHAIGVDDEAALEHEVGAPERPTAAAPAGSRGRPEPEPASDDELGCDAPAVIPAEAPAARPLKASFSASLPARAKEILAAIPAAKIDRIEVKRGDTLISIARSHKVSTGLVRRLNAITGDAIRAGAVLAVPVGPFNATADRANFSLSIELDGANVKKYAIGVGRDGSTPLGDFEVRSRVESPDWTSPEGDYFKSGDPANPLGTRWLGFGEGGYGIHGTTDPTSIGREASRGCVRLNDGDVEEVYDFLTIGSKVTIR